ncbi:unnamed protein product [Cyclocybe aegerita]|uniref:Uncharacterized protein n=1 Tax=Cyclocybe aegerita TaxID=1973307 RepID=A0A8S0XQU4_CYCAE|nr:unnamed protein product [Cyclocybe aegerita]
MLPTSATHGANSSSPPRVSGEASLISGNALLTVKGRFPSSDESAREFFSEILHRNWSRIENLNIEIHKMGSISDDLVRKIWYPISEPSKALKVFQVSNFGCAQPLSTHDRLFGDVAPKLWSFRCLGAEHTTFINAPWLVQLRLLDVNGPLEASPPLSMWLEQLRSMPQLESLSLREAFSAIEESEISSISLPIVQLPQLSDLTLCHELFPVAVFLGHIHAPPQCRLRVVITNCQMPLSSPGTSMIHRNLSAYAKLWKSHTLNFTVTYQKVLLRQDSLHRKYHPLFEIIFFPDNAGDFSRIFTCLNAFPPSDLVHITTLNLQMTQKMQSRYRYSKLSRLTSQH